MQICRYPDIQISGYLGILARKLLSQREQTRLMAREYDSVPQDWTLKRVNEVTWLALVDYDLDGIERGDRYELQNDGGVDTVKVIKVGDDRVVLRRTGSGWSMFEQTRWRD